VRSGELTGRIGVFLLRFGLAAPLCGGNRTINGGDSAGNGSLVGAGLCLGARGGRPPGPGICWANRESGCCFQTLRSPRRTESLQATERTEFCLRLKRRA
jgi:hypothetical protein